MRTPSARQPSGVKRGWAAAPILHLVALTSAAIAQPLFATLENNPVFLLSHHTGCAEASALVLAAVLLPPVFLLAATGLARRIWPPLGDAVFHGSFALPAAALALLALRQCASSAPCAVLLPVAAVAGAAVALARARFSLVREWLTLAAAGAILFPALFLLSPPIRKVLWPANTGGTHQSSSRPGNVVVVVFDEFPVVTIMGPSGDLDEGQFPGFTALARRSTWFRNATSVARDTPHAVPAIVTGNYPSPELLPIAADHPRSLFSLLADTCRAYSFEPMTGLCPPSLVARRSRKGFPFHGIPALFPDCAVLYAHTVLPRDLARALLPPIACNWRDFTASTRSVPAARQGAIADRMYEIVRRWTEHPSAARHRPFEEFLDSVEVAPRGSLHFLHLDLPHNRWIYLPSGKIYSLDDAMGITDDVWSGPETLVAQSYFRHILQARFVDSLLTRLLERMRKLGILEDSLLVVTADHGITFRPGNPARGLAETNLPDLMGVPLFIKLPGRHAGTVDDRNAETTDILPTIADALGIPLPWPVDGRSLLGPASRSATGKLFFDDLGSRTVETTLQKHRAGMAEALKLKAQLLDSRWGPRMAPATAALLGTTARDTARKATIHADAEIDQVPLLDDIDMSARFLPALVTGSLHLPPGTPPPATVLIAVNGIVTAGGGVYKDDGRILFWAIPPERSFHNGLNDVVIFGVPKEGPAAGLVIAKAIRKLAPLTVTIGDDGREAIALDNGIWLPLESRPVAGFIEKRTDTGEGLVIVSGWAVDSNFAIPAELVAVVLNSRVLAIQRPTERRSDLLDYLGWPACNDAGFTVEIPASKMSGAELRSLRVIALSGGHAFELRDVRP